jgi:hypothetical protein
MGTLEDALDGNLRYIRLSTKNKLGTKQDLGINYSSIF